MKKNRDFSKLYGDDYFQVRVGNDHQRLASFQQEKEFIHQYIFEGNILDVGCSTGEFLGAINWQGDKYGMDISEFAIAKAKQVGISFDKDLFSEKDFFDVIIFRGVIQHLDNPFLFMEKAHESLKSGGFVIYLATPNINSMYYKIWSDLPCLDKERNFFLPSNEILIDVMKIYGFEFVNVDFPYLNSPYSSPIRDHFKFLLKFFDSGQEFPFWKSMMNICFIKK